MTIGFQVSGFGTESRRPVFALRAWGFALWTSLLASTQHVGLRAHTSPRQTDDRGRKKEVEKMRGWESKKMRRWEG